MPWGIAAAAVIGGLASVSASQTQAGAQEQAAQTQLQMFNTITGQEQPFLQGGYGAESALLYGLGIPSATGYGGAGGYPGTYAGPGTLGGYAGMGGRGAGGIGLPPGSRGNIPVGTPAGYGGTGLGFGELMAPPTNAALENFPGFQFALQTGGQAVRNADTPGVGALSGAAIKDLTNFDVGTALQQSWQPYQQWQTNLFNRLSGVAGMGQNAAGNLGNAGTQLGTGIAQAQAAAGGSLAAGQVGAANSLSTPLWAYYMANQNPGGGGTAGPTTGFGG